MRGVRNKPEEIWGRVTEYGDPNKCWVWFCHVGKDGYGQITINRKVFRPHRIAYELANNAKIPEGLCVCHTCDNPLCCNPDHLWVGTNIENITDMVRKGRNAAGNRHGSKTKPHRVARGIRSGRYTKPESTSRGVKHSEVMKVVSAKGSKNGNAKLTEEVVVKIRNMRRQGMSQAAIGNVVGVSQNQISQILMGRVWKHV